MTLRQAQHRDAVALDGFNRNQMIVVQPVRHAEQGVAGMRCAARLGQRCPGGISQRDIQCRRVARRLPLRDMIGKGTFGHGLAEPRRQIGAQRGAIEARRIGVLLHRLALDEQPLARVDRIERMGRVRQCQRLRLDAEQRGDERIEMRRERHHQLALVRAGDRIRSRSRRQQTRV